jgi:hypothetical protein
MATAHQPRAAGEIGAEPPVIHFDERRNPMLDPKTLEEIGNKMSALLANSPARDFEKNARAAMGSVFAKLDLVTREEFDIQSQVLARTREKLKALEARVEALEKARTGE